MCHLTDPNKLTLIKHLYIHGCNYHQIVERTKFSKIYVTHAISELSVDDHIAHFKAMNHKGEFHFHKSQVVTGSDAYAEGR